MSEQLRVGVVGTSYWADLMHLPSLKSHPGASIAAICGRRRERAEEMAKKYQIPSVFTDYREMIEKGNLHVLVVATPDDLHYEITMHALEARLHVLCEKPLALTARQAREMYTKAEAVKVKHMTDFSWRWMPHYQYMRQLIDEGYVGRIFQCQMRYVAGWARDQRYGWRFDRQRANGVLGDLGAHAIDLARWYAGDIAKVAAHIATYVQRPGPDGQRLDPANDAAVIILEFANGAQGVIQLSAVAHVGNSRNEQYLSLYGEAGTLEGSLTFNTGVAVHGARRDETDIRLLAMPDHFWPNVDKSNAFMTQFGQAFTRESIGPRLFIDAILDDRPVVPNFYDGWKAQEVIEAAIESARAGRWVALD